MLPYPSLQRGVRQHGEHAPNRMMRSLLATWTARRKQRRWDRLLALRWTTDGVRMSLLSDLSLQHPPHSFLSALLSHTQRKRPCGVLAPTFSLFWLLPPTLRVPQVSQVAPAVSLSTLSLPAATAVSVVALARALCHLTLHTLSSHTAPRQHRHHLPLGRHALDPRRSWPHRLERPPRRRALLVDGLHSQRRAEHAPGRVRVSE